MPDENSLSKIYSKYPQLVETDTTNVSIHLRLKWGAKLTYNSNFIKDAISKIKSKETTGKINFFIFSDNIKKAKLILLNLKQDFIYCNGNSDYIDLWIMSLCNHNIICHSTLGWWGAYLNQNPNKIVIYPSDMLTFFCKKVLGRNNIDLIKENIYPKSWICLKSSSIVKF